MKILFFLVLVLSVKFAHAELELGTYLKFKNEPFNISYVIGMSRGISWATTINAEKGGNKLYCPPADYTQDQDMILSILDSAIERGNQKNLYSKDTPVELIFLTAMEEKFPCP